jgi:hypothetical protein
MPLGIRSIPLFKSMCNIPPLTSPLHLRIYVTLGIRSIPLFKSMCNIPPRTLPLHLRIYVTLGIRSMPLFKSVCNSPPTPHLSSRRDIQVEKVPSLRIHLGDFSKCFLVRCVLLHAHSFSNIRLLETTQCHHSSSSSMSCVWFHFLSHMTLSTHKCWYTILLFIHWKKT